MPDLRKGFITRCNHGHEQQPIFDVDQLRADLARGQVQYFCFRCGNTCAVSMADQPNLRAWLQSLIRE